MAISLEPHIVLLGGGYTLQRVGELLSPDSFVITSRSEETCAEWRAKGWSAARVSLQEPDTLRSLWTAYPSISTVVDSVPPIRAGGDPARGVSEVCATLKGTKVSRIIYLSTTGVFGVRDGSHVSESSPAKPWNAQGEARLQCEQVYRSSGISVTSLRLPAIYGPDRGLHISIKNGSYKMVGKGESWSNRIHVEDLATAIVQACQVPHLPEVLCVSDDCPARSRDVVEYVCTQMGVPMPASVSEQDLLAVGAYTMLSNQRVQNMLMKKVLSLELKYPSYKEGFGLAP